MAEYEVIGMRKQHLYQLKSGFDIFGITEVTIYTVFIYLNIAY